MKGCILSWTVWCIVVVYVLGDVVLFYMFTFIISINFLSKSVRCTWGIISTHIIQCRKNPREDTQPISFCLEAYIFRMVVSNIESSFICSAMFLCSCDWIECIRPLLISSLFIICVSLIQIKIPMFLLL